MAVTGWWPRRVPPRRDVASAAVCTVIGAALFAVGLYESSVPLGLFLIPFAVIIGADLLRGTAPLLALSVGVVAVAADALLGGSISTWQVFFDLVYAACVYGPRGADRWVIGGSAVLTFGALVAVLLVLRGEGEGWRIAVQGGVAVAMVAMLVTVLPATTGAVVRGHRDRLAAHRERARQLARLAELDHRAAVAAERARMARELHDVIAGHLTAIAVQSAGALRLSASAAAAATGSACAPAPNTATNTAPNTDPNTDPNTAPNTDPNAALNADPNADPADATTGSSAGTDPVANAVSTLRESMQVIRDNSVQGLTEMRAMIDVLRDAGSEPTDAVVEHGPPESGSAAAHSTAPGPGPAAMNPTPPGSVPADVAPATTPPGLGGVPLLVDTARRSGLTVTVHDDLTDAGGDLPTAVGLAGYRIVQEALTNALKHAGPGAVEVRLGRTEGAVSIQVTSPLAGRSAHAAPGADASTVPGAGAGLIGMQERAALLGGVLSAGPDEHARWSVRASLPLPVREVTS